MVRSVSNRLMHDAQHTVESGLRKRKARHKRKLLDDDAQNTSTATIVPSCEHYNPSRSLSPKAFGCRPEGREDLQKKRAWELGRARRKTKSTVSLVRSSKF